MSRPTDKQILDALKWARRHLKALVIDDGEHGVFIRGTRTEIVGFTGHGRGMGALERLISDLEPKPHVHDWEFLPTMEECVCGATRER